MDIKNKRISDDEFNRIRAEVLTQWPTGKDVDFQEAVEYQKSIPAERRFAEKTPCGKEPVHDDTDL